MTSALRVNMYHPGFIFDLVVHTWFLVIIRESCLCDPNNIRYVVCNMIRHISA